MELIEKYPEDKNLFLNYIGIQNKLTEKLINEITPVIFVIRKKV
jgi:hypothetical protein